MKTGLISEDCRPRVQALYPKTATPGPYIRRLPNTSLIDVQGPSNTVKQSLYSQCITRLQPLLSTTTSRETINHTAHDQSITLYHFLWQEFLACAAIYTNRCAVCKPIGYDALACSLLECRSTLRSRSCLIIISHTKHMQCCPHYALGIWPRYIFRKRCSVARAPC